MLSKRAATERRTLSILNKLNSAINEVENIFYKMEKYKAQVYRIVRDEVDKLVKERGLYRVGYVGTQSIANDVSAVFFNFILNALKSDLSQLDVGQNTDAQVDEFIEAIWNIQGVKLISTFTDEFAKAIEQPIRNIYNEVLDFLRGNIRELRFLLSQEIASELEKIRATSIDHEVLVDDYINTTAFGLDDIVRWYKELQRISKMQESEEIARKYNKPEVGNIDFRPRDIDSSFFSTGINSMTVYEDRFGNFHFTKVLPPATAFKELFVSSLFRGLTKTIPWNVKQYKNRDDDDDTFTQVSSVGGVTTPSSMIRGEFDINPEEAAMYLILTHVINHTDLSNPDNVRVLSNSKKSPYVEGNDDRPGKLMFIDFELTSFDNEELTEDLDRAESLQELAQPNDLSFLNIEVEDAITRQWESDDGERFRVELKKELRKILKKLTNKYIELKAKQAYKTVYGSLNSEHISQIVRTIAMRRDKLLALAGE